MNDFWLFLFILLIAILLLCLYLILRHKEQAVQVFTFESFINAHHLEENEDGKKSFIETINDFFKDDENDANTDGFDDDGGE